MMKKVNFFFLLCVLFSNCSNIKRVKTTIINEKSLDYSIISALDKKIDLKPIISGVNNFELRVWSGFMKDSFPILLDRVYYEEHVLKLDTYFFYLNGYKPIVSLSDIKGNTIMFTKLNDGVISAYLKDSFLKQFTLGQMSNFDAITERDKLKAEFLVQMPGLCLFEIADKANYHRAFLTHPQLVQVSRFPEYTKYKNMMNIIDSMREDAPLEVKKRFSALIDTLNHVISDY